MHVNLANVFSGIELHGKNKSEFRQELEDQLTKNEEAIAALQADQELDAAAKDEELAALSLAVAATKEALQAVIDEQPWALALAATEQQLDATRDELVALKALMLDTRVTALETVVEERPWFNGYKVVTSGRDCKWITTVEECHEAAQGLGLTVAFNGSWKESFPPGCQVRQDHRGQSVGFNSNLDSTGHCDTIGSDGYNCFCKK